MSPWPMETTVYFQIVWLASNNPLSVDLTGKIPDIKDQI